MVKAVVMHEPGGPEVLKWEDVTVGEPGTGEARVRNTAVGLNFLDTLFRSGAIPMDLPAILGWEAAGVVEAIGGGVTSVAPGMRVAYHTPNGCYAEERLIKADELVPLPDGISEDQGAASILKCGGIIISAGRGRGIRRGRGRGIQMWCGREIFRSA